MASSSLSSVVSGLVRASMGASVPTSVADDDLDRHVAELIIREAKKKAERYGQQGIRAYIASNLSDSNAPKANKRFLTSIIKSTDDHNKTVLRSQALAAQEVKRERDEQERRQRRARAEEAAEAERLRRSGKSGKRKRASDDEGWDRWDGRNSERKKISRNWESWDGNDDDDDEELDVSRSRRRSRSRSRSRSRDRKAEKSSRSRRTRHDDDETSSKHHRHRRSRSPSPRRKRSGDASRERYDDDSRRRKRRRREHLHRDSHRPGTRSQSPSSETETTKTKKRRRSGSPKYALDDLHEEDVLPHPSRHSPVESEAKHDREAELRQRLKDSRKQDNRSLTPALKSRRSRSTGLKADSDSNSQDPGPSSRRSPSLMSSRSPSPGPQLPLQLPSKMDRYFEESYDPRFDVAPLTAPKVPATGLIDNTEFESWDAMLELIRIRREDKEEKKRLDRLGLLPKEKSKSKKKGVVESSDVAVAERWGGEGVSVMDIEYKKRGSVREWDMGKEGF